MADTTYPPTTFTIVSTAVYTTTDTKDSYSYKTGDIIPYALAVRLGLAPAVTMPTTSTWQYAQDSQSRDTARFTGLERVLRKYYFADDFDRPNTLKSNGVDDNGLGNGWKVTGPAFASARINDGAYVTDGNVYAYRQLAFTPGRQACRFVMPAGARSIVLLSSPAETLFTNCIHINLAHDSLAIQKITATVFANVEVTAIPSLRDGKEHEFAWELTGTTLRTFIDGAQVNTATDATFPNLIGTYNVWQQSLPETGTTSPRITFAEASVGVA